MGLQEDQPEVDGTWAYDDEPKVDTAKKYDDWRDQLVEDGYAVVKGVLSPEQANHYLDRFFDWLETFPYGFKRADDSTWGPEHLPVHIKGGMYHGYALAHEKFYWDARLEPTVIDAFAKVWGTHKLLVSFDGANLTLPNPNGHGESEYWPHVDQSPLRRGMQCVQGILNLAPNGPQDGGLIVMKGSSRVNEKFFEEHSTERKTWGPADWFGFTREEVGWFAKQGCKTIKVCAEPGDLILWDSRTVHYNCLPESENLRSVFYICYTPASYAKEEDLKKKADLFHQRIATTHWPHANIFPNNKVPLRLGKEDTYNRSRPVEEPAETERLLQLAGVVPYHTSEVAKS